VFQVLIGSLVTNLKKIWRRGKYEFQVLIGSLVTPALEIGSATENECFKSL